VVTVPLAPRTARAIDLAIGERTEGPLFMAADGRRLDWHGAGRIVRRRPAGPGSPRPSRLTRFGTRSSPPPWMPGCRCGTCRRPPRTPIRGPRCGTTGPAAAWTGTQPTSSLPTSQAPLGNPRVLGELCRLAATTARRRLSAVIRHGPQPRTSARTAVWRGGRVDAALGACRTDLRIIWRPLLVIRVSQLVSRAADHR
jgi:hypothetical protein